MKTLTLALLFWLGDVVRSACPSPFVAVGMECFYLSSEKLNWDNARAKCQTMGGDLAVPSNVALLDDFVFPTAVTKGVWIGGRDVVEGDWDHFINGEPINPLDWATTPDIQPDDNGGNEDCLELRSYFDPPMNDYRCNVEQQFVCEAPCPYEEPKCPPPFKRVGDECFYLGTTNETWCGARFNCLQMGGDLAVPADLNALEAFVFPEAGTSGVWLGGTDQDNEGDWSYVDGSAISGWGPLQPDNHNNQDCLEAREDMEPPLNDCGCHVQQNYVCEVDLPCPCPDHMCPAPFTKVGNECFYLSPNRLPWGAARNTCRSMGGDLAVPSHVPTLDAFVFPTAVSPGVWIGGTDQDDEDNWHYLNGDPIHPWDWHEPQPDNFGGNEHCLEIRRDFAPPVNDYVCSRLQQFVCEVPTSCPCLECPRSCGDGGKCREGSCHRGEQVINGKCCFDKCTCCKEECGGSCGAAGDGQCRDNCLDGEKPIPGQCSSGNCKCCKKECSGSCGAAGDGQCRDNCLDGETPIPGQCSSGNCKCCKKEEKGCTGQCPAKGEVCTPWNMCIWGEHPQMPANNPCSPNGQCVCCPCLERPCGADGDGQCRANCLDDEMPIPGKCSSDNCKCCKKDLRRCTGQCPVKGQVCTPWQMCPFSQIPINNPCSPNGECVCCDQRIEQEHELVPFEQ